MASEELKAAATGGTNLTPANRMKLKIDSIQKQMQVAIPETMRRYLTAERLTRLFWQEARRTPKLLDCQENTIATGLMTAAQLGIEIGVMGQGWLVPFWNNKKKRNEAQFIIGYKGLIALARRSGDVLSIETHIVYADDKFTLKLGIDPKVEHEPKLDGPRGNPKLVYGVARFRDGGFHFEWMSWADIMKMRDRSQAGDRGPWVSDTEQMARKTLIRRMSNYLPMSIEFANALEVDTAAAAGKHAAIEGAFTIVDDDSDLTDDGAGGPIPPVEPGPAEDAPGSRTSDAPPAGVKAPPAADASQGGQPAAQPKAETGKTDETGGARPKGTGKIRDKYVKLFGEAAKLEVLDDFANEANLYEWPAADLTAINAAYAAAKKRIEG